MRKRSVVLAGLLLWCGACGGDDQPPRHEMTQRERDSVIGASRLPGARGVRGALEASDSAAARRRRADSIANDTAR